MSVDLKNLPKPEAYGFMPDDEYDRFALQQFAEIEFLAEESLPYAEWAATVLTKMAAPTSPIALPLETIEVLIQIADDSIWVRDRIGNASDREKTVLGEVAYAYMRKTGIWPDLKSVNPPKEIADTGVEYI